MLLLLQFNGSSVYVFIILVFPFPGLDTTLVCVTCSQLEKLTADLLNIRQKLDTSEQDSSTEADRNQQVFCRMQMQLNGCIHYHHQILRYMHTLHVNLNYLLDIKKRYQLESYTEPKIVYKMTVGTIYPFECNQNQISATGCCNIILVYKKT
jgi:hypothetical protein